ncbi:hypothetical protein ACFFX1_18245 [Dactylosporangium sucinum]|uniref:Uncharacterized protein n=1 Tax=Dactylosporangium sucinum TaxID=1424081 RepID=A0A917WY76_9ACTN|nr:hypothetical protein [Dactylosporangium sucinum]GGM41069.1 hypothetical protein GCM10007977_048120 [Dactylosporangium sucinum]
MELRAELCPPAVTPERVDALCAAIEAVEELLDRGDTGAAEAAIAAFNAGTGHDYTAYHFRTYAGSRDVEDFALEAARPARPKVAGVTRDELAEVVRRVRAGGPDTDYYVLLLTTNVLYPGVVDLIFHPPAELADASAAEIVDVALRYRPIAL